MKREDLKWIFEIIAGGVLFMLVVPALCVFLFSDSGFHGRAETDKSPGMQELSGKISVPGTIEVWLAEKEKVDMEANVLDWEPSIALFVPDEDPLLFYRKIAQLGCSMLKEGGTLYFEINRAYGQETIQMLEAMGYKEIELRKDSWGNDRMMKAER